MAPMGHLPFQTGEGLPPGIVVRSDVAAQWLKAVPFQNEWSGPRVRNAAAAQ